MHFGQNHQMFFLYIYIILDYSEFCNKLLTIFCFVAIFILRLAKITENTEKDLYTKTTDKTKIKQ